ncbi:hypothetical protein ACI3QN_13620, partial [Propionibacterium freudenreichii]|uniref:hypothetical protein n=1 Tax=Propionibacterium freudenreichii TaxID=1744 RepID=UPI003854D63A
VGFNLNLSGQTSVKAAPIKELVTELRLRLCRSLRICPDQDLMRRAGFLVQVAAVFLKSHGTVATILERTSCRKTLQQI